MSEEFQKPLPKKKIQYNEWQLKHKDHIEIWERVLFFNPKKIYKRLGNRIDKNKRHIGLSMDDVFPKIIGKCACGCKLIPPSGNDWQRKWGNYKCQSFASNVLSIINNYFGKPAFFINIYYGKKCFKCESTLDLELDHIIGVKHGGGGCWLSNYMWLCKVCHNNKTNKDFSRKEYKLNKNPKK